MAYDILITGANGFVGKYLVEALKKTSHRLHLLVRNQNSLASEIKENCNVISLSDTLWKQHVKKANPQIVFHLASFLTSADDEQTIDKLISENLSFGTHLLNALEGTELKCFVNTGTITEYKDGEPAPDPIYLYAATKTAFRSILDYYSAVAGFKVIHVVPSTIYGGLDSKKKLVDFIYDSITAQEPVKMSPGEQVLDFIHIQDIVSFYVKLIDEFNNLKNTKTEVLLGTGKGTTPRQLAQIIEKISGKKTNINWGGLSYRKRDTMFSVASRNLPSQLFSWTPEITIETGVKNYLTLLERSSS